MQYKTITLELIRERTGLYKRLRRTRRLLSALDAHAAELRTNHEAAKEAIVRQRPGSDPSQVAAEALELAILELRDRLPSGSSKDGAEPMSLDAPMRRRRRRTPPG